MMKRAASTRLPRSSSAAAAARISIQLRAENGTESGASRARNGSEDRDASVPSSSSSAPESEDREEKPPKRRKPNGAAIAAAEIDLDVPWSPGSGNWAPARLPARQHTVRYHDPLLLDGRGGLAARDALLSWFDGVASSRRMPWRKEWIDPAAPRFANDASALRAALERRAYEVWISEVMLQQTRVATVVDYWTRWMARWPTIRDLAAAEPDEVLSAWRGLGYYSRARRAHDAAKLVVAHEDMRGLLPRDVDTLQELVPGVGRYTAGAVAAIVFGKAQAMVDGNVMRVLSRQLGLLAIVKEKAVVDTLWSAAEALATAVARGGDENPGTEPPLSDRPGRWGQALMELGSTVCTPKPACAACPITATCRAYAEGRTAASATRAARRAAAADLRDIDDMCSICEPMENAPQDDIDAPTKRKTSGAAGARSGFFTERPAAEVITGHARRFPLKTIKKPLRREETLVCAVRRGDGRYLIRRRPDKGLLPGLWELPSLVLSDGADSTPATRAAEAASFVTGLGSPGATARKRKVLERPEHVGELGSVPWQFSHLKLTMHLHLFHVADGFDGLTPSGHRWATQAEIGLESMGTGMRKCWALVTSADS